MDEKMKRDTEIAAIIDPMLARKAAEHEENIARGGEFACATKLYQIHWERLVGHIAVYREEIETRIRAEARAEALREAAERAVSWYRSGQIIPAHKESYSIKQLRTAILADEPKEERGAEVGE